MFPGESSRSGISHLNPDGTYNIYCMHCGEYISRAYIKINKVLCAICEAAYSGTELTEEFVREYRASKMLQSRAVGLLAMPEEQPVIEGAKKKKLGFITGYLFGAVGRFLLGTKPVLTDAEGAPVEELRSREVAKAKRRPRIFSNGITISGGEDNK